MKLTDKAEILILENYKGSVLKIEEDSNIFISVKRTIRKNIVHETIKENSKIAKAVSNQILTLLNLFDEPIMDEVFKEILVDTEIVHYNSLKFHLKLSFNQPIDFDFIDLLKA